MELDGFFRTVSACVCSVCLSVCVFLALLVCVCLCAPAELCLLSASVNMCVSVHIEMCKNVCVTGYGVTGRSSSPQTRPDDEEGSSWVQSAAVCCGAASNLGHGLRLRLNEK